MVILLISLAFSSLSHAAHPLVTDDTGTQGKGDFQIELNYEFDHEDSGGVKEDLHQIESVLSYGIMDSLDFMVGIPYQVHQHP
jgi:hypothetical protein